MQRRDLTRTRKAGFRKRYVSTTGSAVFDVCVDLIEILNTEGVFHDDCTTTAITLHVRYDNAK